MDAVAHDLRDAIDAVRAEVGKLAVEVAELRATVRHTDRATRWAAGVLAAVLAAAVAHLAWPGHP